MSDHSRRQFLGAAAALPFVGATSDSGEGNSPAESERRRFVDDDSPAAEDLQPEKIELTRPTVEDYRKGEDGHVAIRPLWEPDNPEVAQVSISVGPLDITSSLGTEGVDELISELEHAKEIAREYEES